MKHLRKFDSVTDMQTAIETAAVDFVGLAYDTQTGTAKVSIAKEVPPDPKATPFYIDVRSTVTLAATSGLQMSTDGKTWTDTAAGDLPTGKTYFRVASDQETPLKPNWTENSNSDYDIGGNINSLVKTSFKNDTTCYSFSPNSNGFFQYNNKLKSAGNLILPATTMLYGRYRNMFQSCMSLTTAPALPATTLADSCYYNMFYNCTSLTTAPELPATTLATQCYSAMFSGCTSLTTAPALPATTLAERCYSAMFNGCTSLTTAPALPATTLANSCYYNMFDGCTLLTTAPALPATTLAQSCYSGMFQRCTTLTTAPNLPATTLTESCYQYMFSGCTSLTTAPELPATTLVSSCYSQMFTDCSNLNYIKCLATDISASGCTTFWVMGVASTGTFVKNPSMEGWTTGRNGIPSGWTVQDDAVQ